MLDKLPLDLVHVFLSSLSDLHTLSVAIQTSKRVYGVYQAHWKSIRVAVARNEIGPALPQACRLAKVRLLIKEEDYFDEFGFDDFERFLDDIPQEAGVDVPMVLSDWDLAQTVSKNAGSVAVVEEYFSRRCALLSSFCTSPDSQADIKTRLHPHRCYR